jgi:hypothetical protein
MPIVTVSITPEMGAVEVQQRTRRSAATSVRVVHRYVEPGRTVNVDCGDGLDIVILAIGPIRKEV